MVGGGGRGFMETSQASLLKNMGSGCVRQGFQELAFSRRACCRGRARGVGKRLCNCLCCSSIHGSGCEPISKQAGLKLSLFQLASLVPLLEAVRLWALHLSFSIKTPGKGTPFTPHPAPTWQMRQSHPLFPSGPSRAGCEAVGSGQ